MIPFFGFCSADIPHITGVIQDRYPSNLTKKLITNSIVDHNHIEDKNDDACIESKVRKSAAFLPSTVNNVDRG